jgi:hypothetical protein
MTINIVIFGRLANIYPVQAIAIVTKVKMGKLSLYF